MKIETSSLTGKPLDWAVATCERISVRKFPESPSLFIGRGFDKYSPSTDWSTGGLIIEREEIAIDVRTHPTERWIATSEIWDDFYSGPTPLIAAMRCFVASKLGDNVDIPDDLVDQ